MEKVDRAIEEMMVKARTSEIPYARVEVPLTSEEVEEFKNTKKYFSGPYFWELGHVLTIVSLP